MITIKLKVEIGSVLRGLVDAEKQLPYVMARALTLTGQDVKNAETRAISVAVQAPTPYTLRAVYLESATAKRDHLLGVWLKNGNHRQHYLLSMIEGGGRPMKAFEKMLRGAGFMRPNERAVPGKAMQLDAYGNLSRAQINRIVSAITMQGPPAPKPVATKRKRASSVSSGGYFFSAGTASKRAVFGRYGAADQHLPRRHLGAAPERASRLGATCAALHDAQQLQQGSRLLRGGGSRHRRPLASTCAVQRRSAEPCAAEARQSMTTPTVLQSCGVAQVGLASTTSRATPSPLRGSSQRLAAAGNSDPDRALVAGSVLRGDV